MFAIILTLIFLASCSSEDNHGFKGEYIYRREGDKFFEPPPPKMILKEAYPWEEGRIGNLPKITKEYLRCKGSSLNPPRSEHKEGETVLIHDCGGSEKHSLPLKDNKEFIYPILLELLNHIQAKTKKRVVITSGHRCPDHNNYVDSSPSNQTSKHCIGAEVKFYVQGMEDKPEAIIKLIQDYYKTTCTDKKFTEFKRYEKNDTDVSTLPWMNQEIFIKLYHKKEGRDFDNRHPYPYISLQVRTAGVEKVQYTWDKAYNNYLRY